MSLRNSHHFGNTDADKHVARVPSAARIQCLMHSSCGQHVDYQYLLLKLQTVYAIWKVSLRNQTIYHQSKRKTYKARVIWSCRLAWCR